MFQKLVYQVLKENTKKKEVPKLIFVTTMMMQNMSQERMIQRFWVLISWTYQNQVMTKLVIWTYDVLAWLEDNQKYIYGMHDNNDINDKVSLFPYPTWMYKYTYG